MVDKYILDFEEGEIFKDELFLIPPEAKLSWDGNKDSLLCNVFSGSKEIEDCIAFLDSVIGQIPAEEKLNLKSTHFVKLEKQLSFLQLARESKCNVFFFWGSIKDIEGVSLEEFAPERLGDKWLLSLPAVDIVKESNANKAALWKAMKFIFKIK